MPVELFEVLVLITDVVLGKTSLDSTVVEVLFNADLSDLVSSQDINALVFAVFVVVLHNFPLFFVKLDELLVRVELVFVASVSIM